MAGYSPNSSSFMKKKGKAPAGAKGRAEKGPTREARPGHETYNEATGESVLECPYNKGHQVSKARFGNHVSNCRYAHVRKLKAQGETVRYIDCQWDDSHSVPEFEAAFHAKFCQSAGKSKETRLLEQEMMSKVAQKTLATRKTASIPELEGLEDWEDKLESQERRAAYDPQKKLESGFYYYQPSGLTKAEKKQHRELQRSRFNAFKGRHPQFVHEGWLEPEPAANAENGTEFVRKRASPTATATGASPPPRALLGDDTDEDDLSLQLALALSLQEQGGASESPDFQGSSYN